jgi:protein-tyrosine-phosphatase
MAEAVLRRDLADGGVMAEVASAGLRVGRVLQQSARDGEAAKIRLLGSFDPAAGAGWDVPDPVTGGRADFERVLGLLRAAMPGVVTAVRAGVAGS